MAAHGTEVMIDWIGGLSAC